jgi:hypothetical protein
VVTKEQTVSSRAPAGRSLAHVRRNGDGSCAIHDLEDHVRVVGDLSSGVVLLFGASDWDQLIGLVRL